MAQDLTIRLLGRPKVSKDSQLGFQRLSRKYVVQGPRASKAGIEDRGNPLFLAVGTPDEEFTDHYLVNQQIEPAQGSMDKAYLSRDFVQIRETYNSESISESGDLKKITRRYAVLRASHNKGYDASSWANHPYNLGSEINDPWDYLPTAIKNTEPTTVSYTDTGSVPANLFSSASATPPNLGAPTVDIAGVGTTSLADALDTAVTTDNLSIKWVRATAQVDSSNPGVDVWSVSWVAPVTDHWVVGNGKASSGTFKMPSMVHFDTHGMRIYNFGQNGASGPTTMYTYISYVVGADPGTTLTSLYGTGSVQPATTFDFHFLGMDGNHRSQSFKKSLSNTFWVQDTQSGMSLPDKDGNDVKVADGQPYHIILNYEYATEAAVAASFDSTGGRSAGAYNALPASSKTKAIAAYKGFTEPPIYQGNKIIKANGVISFSHAYVTTGGGSSSSMGNSIKPIFSHGSEKIWKISLTYVS
jgi:hypothetical protein